MKKISTDNIDSYRKDQYRKYHENKHDKQQIKPPQDTKTIENTLKYRKHNFDRPDSVVLERKSVVALDSRIRDTDKFAYAYDFEAPFGRVFKNVKSIRLVSSEIPNSDQVIRETPAVLKNNTMYWQNNEDDDLNYIDDVKIDTLAIDPDSVILTIEEHNIILDTFPVTLYNSKLDTDLIVTGFIDGTYIGYRIDDNNIKILYKGGIPASGTTNVDLGKPIYAVDFKPGNYTATTLTNQMEESFNFIKRRNNKGQYHYFEVNVNLDTDVITFDSVITTQLPSNPISTTAASEIITVTSNSHGFKTGDRVKMIDVRTLAGINGTKLSGDFIVNVLDFNTFTYEVNERATESSDGGGNTVKTGRDAPFRFLLDTQNTLIQYVTGFADEDSTEAIGSTDSITTYAIPVTSVLINGDYLRFITPFDHGLEEVTKISISAISTGSICEVTTVTNHGFEKAQVIYIRDSNSVPKLDGYHNIIPNGTDTFIIDATVTTAGTTGQILYNGDKIAISGLKVTPQFTSHDFHVENVLAPNVLEIRSNVEHFDIDSVPDTLIRTSQIFINHPNHGFTNLYQITAFGTEFANISTITPHSYVGSYSQNISVIEGTTNAVDIIFPNHELITSDVITIRNSTSDPIIDGVYKIQVVDAHTIRINFVFTTFVPGVAEIFTGDKINITKSNSLPKIDGYWYINNKTEILNISTGVTEIDITTHDTVSWSIGDTVLLSGTDSVPTINGEFVIKDIISSTVFTIEITEPVIVSGSNGKVVNRTSGTIFTGQTITTPGNYAILGRSQNVLHYRIEAESLNGDNIGGIQLNALNSKERTITRIIDKDNYMLRTDNHYATHTSTAGGTNIRVSSERHGHRSIQANTDTGESTGKLFRSISLEGENYIYLTIPNLETMYTTNASIKDVFAKIVLTESPGLMCFNSFVSVPKEFDPPLDKLDKLYLKMIDYRGYPFDFHDLNYSISLEITELYEKVNDANLLPNASAQISTQQKDKDKKEDEKKKEQRSVKSGSSDAIAGGRFGITRNSGSRQ